MSDPYNDTVSFPNGTGASNGSGCIDEPDVFDDSNGTQFANESCGNSALDNCANTAAFVNEISSPCSIKAVDILETAADLLTADRAKAYGEMRETHEAIADMWSLQLRDKLKEPLTARDAAELMAGLKLIRMRVGSHHPDNYVDLAGYAGIAGAIAAVEHFEK